MGDPALDTHVDGGRDELRLVRRLLDQLPALVAYWDAAGRNVVANHAYVDYYGMDPADLRGMHISDLLGEELYARNLPYISGALAGREQLFDRTLVDQHGVTHYMQGSYVPDVAGDVVRGFFALLTDVTPRVEAQRAMDQAESIARLGSWELDVSTDRVTWSRNLYEIAGLDPDDDAPRTLPVRMVHIHPDDEDRVLATVEQAIETGLSYACHYRILTLGGLRAGGGEHRPTRARPRRARHPDQRHDAGRHRGQRRRPAPRPGQRRAAPGQRAQRRRAGHAGPRRTHPADRRPREP